MSNIQAIEYVENIRKKVKFPRNFWKVVSFKGYFFDKDLKT